MPECERLDALCAFLFSSARSAFIIGQKPIHPAILTARHLMLKIIKILRVPRKGLP